MERVSSGSAASGSLSHGENGAHSLSHSISWLHSIPWTMVIVAAGLGLRSIHYGRNPAMWHDEAALVINVLYKDFSELLGPLYFAEAGPPLFMWVERAIVWVLGDGIYSLRLLPFVASCVALLLMVPISRRLLSPTAVPWCLLLVACSDRLLAHSCEAKPYAVDVCVAAALAGIFCFTQPWPLARQLLLYALLAPPVIFLVYPGLFLCTGLLLALLLPVWRERKPHVWSAFGLFAIAVAVSSTLLVLGPATAQRDQHMDVYWTAFFPDWQRPWSVPLWVLRNTVRIFDYCFEPIGSGLAVVAIVGAINFWRRKQHTLVIALTGPIFLNLVAACLQKYPYGGSRVMIYALPAAALLVAEGVTPTWNWLRAQHRLVAGVGTVALLILLLQPLSRSLYHAVRPWPRAASDKAAAFVLARLQPGDGVIGNYWVDLYYFRRLGAAFRPVGSAFRAEIRPYLPPAPRDTPRRLWIVMTGDSAPERAWIPGALPPGQWRVLERQSFRSVDVTLVSRQKES